MSYISESPPFPPTSKQLILSNLEAYLEMICKIFAIVKMLVAGIAMVFNIGSLKGKNVFYATNQCTGFKFTSCAPAPLTNCLTDFQTLRPASANL